VGEWVGWWEREQVCGCATARVSTQKRRDEREEAPEFGETE
jgi:hypothetical protein